jgi:hypothetical protein
MEYMWMILEAHKTRKDCQIKLEAQPTSSLGLRVQDQYTLICMPRSHPGSVLDILYMYGNLRRQSLQWIWSHAKKSLESMGIIKIQSRPE